MITKNYYTEASLEKIKQQLTQLQTQERKKIAQQIGEAMEKGDLSENAEYHAAKEAQGHLEVKIASLQNEIAHAKIIDETNLNTTTVSLLNQVTLKNLTTEQTLTYKIVPAQEVNLKLRYLSIASPISQAILGKKKGDTVTVHVPAGILTFQILDIGL